MNPNNTFVAALPIDMQASIAVAWGLRLPVRKLVALLRDIMGDAPHPDTVRIWIGKGLPARRSSSGYAVMVGDYFEYLDRREEHEARHAPGSFTQNGGAGAAGSAQRGQDSLQAGAEPAATDT